jgi:PIN domain nuclease of toxin-antitoxin system
MSNILLDTHAALWFLDGDPRISPRAKEAILSVKNRKFISMASVWEVAIKISIGKLGFDDGAKGFIELLAENGFELLPIAAEHVLRVETLAFLHRDPFDRLIIATCIEEGMSLVSGDENIWRYPIQIIW